MARSLGPLREQGEHRKLHSTCPGWCELPRISADLCRIKLTFRDSKGNEIKTIEGNEGDDILSLAHEYDVDLEGGSISLGPELPALTGCQAHVRDQ